MTNTCLPRKKSIDMNAGKLERGLPAYQATSI